METTVTASDFRNKFPQIVQQVKNGETLIAILRSRPVFKVVPLSTSEKKENWLSKIREAGEADAPSMEEINKIVHNIRKNDSCGY